MADRIITPDTFARNRSSRKRSSIASGTGGSVRNISGGGAYGASPSASGSTSESRTAATGPATGRETGSVTYTSGFRGSTRNKPIKDRLLEILDSAAKAAGVRVVITSGGQDPPGPRARRTGSRRHDNGFAVDVQLYNGGTLLYTSNSSHLNMIITFCRAARSAGATAIGAGNGYMNNRVIHLDIAAGQPGVSNSKFWGGRAMNAAGTPSWLREIMS
jgi:hypothetical protein